MRRHGDHGLGRGVSNRQRLARSNARGHPDHAGRIGCRCAGGDRSRGQWGQRPVGTYPLPQVVVDALTPRIAGRKPDDPAVTSPNGALLRSNNWRRHTHWKKALKATKLAPLTIHDLRHAYASLARKSGADLRYVQKTMGHSTPTVTANIYSDLYSDELDQVATNLDQLHNNETKPRNTGEKTGRRNQSIECTNRVHAGQKWWPGPGSNRRPSAFQADARTN